MEGATLESVIGDTRPLKGWKVVKLGCRATSLQRSPGPTAAVKNAKVVTFSLDSQPFQLVPRRKLMASAQSDILPSRPGNNEREATELNDYESDRIASGNITRSAGRETYPVRSISNEDYAQSFRRSTALFWKRQVSATVPHECCRDHFGTPPPFQGNATK